MAGTKTKEKVKEQSAARATKSKSVNAAKNKIGVTIKSAGSAKSAGKSANHSGTSWTFLTNYAHVLICLAREPELTLREVSFQVGITERAVQRIIADLEGAGVLVRSRDGRRNRYEIQREVLLRHPLEAHRSINDLLAMVLQD